MPDDPWGYREAFIDAFAAHGIYPRNVTSLSEEELTWETPEVEPDGELLTIPGISETAFLSAEERNGRELQAEYVANFVAGANAAQLRALGLRRPGNGVSVPEVHSVRVCRRRGPKDELRIDLIVEILQAKRAPMPFHGGSTVIIGVDGRVRFAIKKRVDDARRLERQQHFMSGAGAEYWRVLTEEAEPATELLRRLHRPPEPRPALTTN